MESTKLTNKPGFLLLKMNLYRHVIDTVGMFLSHMYYPSYFK
jgi:hypothetical protein